VAVWNVCPKPFVGSHRAVYSSPRLRPPRLVSPLFLCLDMSDQEIHTNTPSLSDTPSAESPPPPRRRAPLSLCSLLQPLALPAALSLFHCLAPRLPPVCLHPHMPLTILLWIRQGHTKPTQSPNSHSHAEHRLPRPTSPFPTDHRTPSYLIIDSYTVRSALTRPFKRA
jgi:hypothetical protein